MKIIYSPQYDAETYLGDTPRAMGTAYVGNQGLLQQLELRSGHPVLPVSDVERETCYLSAVKSHMADSPFQNAFQVDDLGVAGKLLAWRDALLMAGWDGTCADPNARKLYTLAQIEAEFHAQSLGNADRWRVLCDAFLSASPIGEQIEEIQVDTPWQELPCLIRRTLTALEQRGVTLTRLEEEEQTMQPEKYKVVSFPQLLQAYEWAATAEWPTGTTVVNRDNTLLNHVLYTWDKPRVHASFTQSNPQLTQLFKLSISIFSRPLNIQNLTSYLLLPAGPIPGKLRRQLADQLIADGGFGEGDKWDQIIRDYTFINKEGEETPQARAQKMRFLAPIRGNYEEGIPHEDMTTYISALRQWVQSHFATADLPDALRVQYQELQAQLAAFSTALSTMSGTLQYADIEKLVLRIYRPMSYSLQSAEQGSLLTVPDVRGLIQSPRTLVWLDCQEEDKETDAYDFLSPQERTYLQEHDAEIPDFAQHLRAVRQERLRYLAKAEKIILVRSAYHGTTRLGEHSLIAELKQLCGGELPEVVQEAQPSVTIASLDIDKLEPKEAYELGPINYEGRTESYSSVDSLLNCPFDYMANYVARFREPDDDQPNNTSRIQGNVAHLFFQQLIEENQDADYAALRRVVETEFEVRLHRALDAKGLVLYLPENAVQLNLFRSKLRESVLQLIDLMEQEHLRPYGCEVAIPEEGEEPLSLEGIGPFGARIDFLLKDEQGHFEIFDFKWSEHRKNYASQAGENQSLQLELYRRAVQASGHLVAGAGYYLFPLKEYLSTQQNDEFFLQTQADYQRQRAQLLEGHIEDTVSERSYGIKYQILKGRLK